LDNEDAADVAAAMDHAFSSAHNRLNSQQADVDGIRAQLASANLGIVHLNQQGEQLREELRGWVDENVRQQIAGAEATLQRSIERTQLHTLDALVEGVQTRVILRISKLEEEVAGQSAAMADLRECSLSTERSMRKLLEGIDRLVATQARAEAKPEEPRAPDSAMPPSAGEGDAVVRPEPIFGSGAAGEKPPFRRWGLFR
jgi:chromosome segregation ATPase